MVYLIAVSVCRERVADPAVSQAIDLARRTGAKLLVVATAPPERGEVAVELPGFEPSPVDRALPQESMWPAEEAQPSTIPEAALATAKECERAGVPCRIKVSYERPAAALKDVSRLADLVVACRPGLSREMRSREALALGAEAACPVLFAASESLIPHAIAVFYDGKVSSSRVMRFAAGLCKLANLRLHVAATAASKPRVEELMSEAEALAVGYGVEHEVVAVRGLNPKDFPAYAEDIGCEIAAAGASSAFMRAGFGLTSIILLTGN
ncbi:MAG: universal stress protein [Armatimonadetes bacterium]|nr:universal stress protein [Armatimonadota bacterium]